MLKGLKKMLGRALIVLPSLFLRKGRSSSFRVLWQQAGSTSLAVVVAFIMGSSFAGSDGVTAAILCAITLRISLQATINEAFAQIFGTGVGVVFGVCALYFINSQIVAIGVSVLFAVLAAKLLRLGDFGQLTIAVSSIIILGGSGGINAASPRMVGSLIGVAVAVAFSFFVHPSSPIGRVRREVEELALNTAELVSVMALGVREGFDSLTSGEWLRLSRLLNDRVPALKLLAEEAVSYASWSPLAKRGEAELTRFKSIAVEHCVVQVRSIARSFFDVSELEVSSRVLTSLSDELLMVSSALTELAGSWGFIDFDGASLLAIRGGVRESFSLIPECKSETELSLLMLVATCVTRIMEAVEGSSAAVEQVETARISSNLVSDIAAAVIEPSKRVIAKL